MNLYLFSIFGAFGLRTTFCWQEYPSYALTDHLSLSHSQSKWFEGGDPAPISLRHVTQTSQSESHILFITVICSRVGYVTVVGPISELFLEPLPKKHCLSGGIVILVSSS